VYRGNWWGRSTPGEPRAASSSLRRNFDSGIHIPSDDTVSSDAASEFMLQNSSQSQYQRTQRSISASGGPSSVISAAEILINKSLEASSEVFDLSFIELYEFEANLVIKMKTLVKVPGYLDETHSPKEDDFRSLQPNMQLFLANNYLTSLPSNFWDLDSLTVLSLRNNGIRELPASISRLVNLTELNVANNELRWLPWELLSLIGPGKPLAKLHVSPNPFVQPVTRLKLGPKTEIIRGTSQTINLNRCLMLSMTEQEWKDNVTGRIRDPSLEDFDLTTTGAWTEKLRLELQKLIMQIYPNDKHVGRLSSFWYLQKPSFIHRAVYLASSQVGSFTIDGRPDANSMPLRDQEDPIPAVALPSISSREITVKSLVEQSIFVASQHDVTYENLPQSMQSAMSIAQESWNEGGRICSVCKRQYVIPRTEWLEYHHIVRNVAMINENDIAWPFLRRGCTPGCVRYKEDNNI